jgi:hypothetical protein
MALTATQQQALTAQGSKPVGTPAPVQKPFCQASKKGWRLVGTVAPAISATPAAIGPFTLTASGGYIRRYVLETILTGATSGGVLSADGPWNLFALVTLTEPNNNPIVNLTGYNLYLADIYSGFSAGANPGADPDYSTTFGNLNMWPYVPVEHDPTGLGALSDLSSSSGYQLYLLPNPDTTVWSTLPSSLPTATVNVYADFWTLPDRSDGQGNQQTIVPPRAGTICMWNQVLNIVLAAGGGNQEMQLNRMGNQIKTVLTVTRVSTARSDTPFPNPFRLEWDDVILQGADPQILRKKMWEMVIQQSPRPVGVHAFFFNDGIERNVGGNGASSWLSTVTDTRFALAGQYPAATAPTLDYIVNDVSRAPLGSVERTTVGPSGPGYHPALPTPAMSS